MRCAPSDADAQLVKVLILGAPGAGVSSFIGAVADHPPVPGPHYPGLYDDHDNTGPGPAVVPVDFGSCLLSPDGGLQLGLFGAHTRRLWPDLVRDTAAAVVLAHSGRIAEAHTSVTALARTDPRIPFVVAVNTVGDAPTAAGVRALLGLWTHVPVVLCDARHRASVTDVLTDALGQALAAHRQDGAA